ncbi:MAG: adenylate/guanylate cyclase domain-containing protein [Glaciecola sp.]
MFWTIITTCVIALYAVYITALWWLQRKQLTASVPPKVARTIKPPVQSNIHNDPILQKADEAQHMLQTFQKFVPRQFVDHFAMGGAESLKLGFASEDEVAMMFCDIRGFTSLSEKMSPQQLMNFLNSYFVRMNAPIHDNYGFIDKFIGDAIMALFDHPQGSASDKASDAVQAALGLQKALRLYNHHRANSGYEPINNGIGLHFGPVILGTVGSDDRMDTTVLGDTVNIAQRIESLTQRFSSDILASRELVNAASEKLDFAWRSIDTVYLRGKSSSIEIIEIYQHLSQDEIDTRNACKKLIEEGVALRNDKYFQAAIDVFRNAQALYPADKVLEYHLTLCNSLMYADDWDGKVKL